MINNLAGSTDWIDDVMEFSANWLIYAVFAVTAVLAGHALYRRRPLPVVNLGLALGMAFAAAMALSHLNGQVRPFQSHQVHQLIPHDNGVSLPSDHATAAFTIALGVGVFLHRKWGIALLAAAAAIGLARIWVGVHYPGDILAALAIAVLAVVVSAFIARVRQQRASLRADGNATVTANVS
jgi:undecaprenyl-diphosphatase